MPTVFTRKNNGFSCLTSQIPQPIASRVVTDACQNNLAKLFSRRSPRGSFETKPCMLVNMADELQNTSQFFRRFTIPPDPLDTQIPRPGPYLFHSIGMQNQFPHYGQAAVPPYQVPMPHASPSTSSVARSESRNTTNEENPQPGATNRNRRSNWTDAETSYLLELWMDNFPISKKRNSTVWDAIAKKLNSIFKDKGIPSYRTGTQCKARIKYLQDKYKRVKDHNSRSGNNRKSFEYYDEMDELVLGSKPNITPKEVVECGLVKDDNATGVGDSEASPESSIPADHESDAHLEQEFEKNLKGNPKHSKKKKEQRKSACRKENEGCLG